MHDTSCSICEKESTVSTAYRMCIHPQRDAIRSTRAVLEDEVDPARLPAVQFVQGCHSSMQVCLFM